MREQFRAELTPDKKFRPLGDGWMRWKERNAPGFYMFSPRKEGPPRKLNQNALYWLRIDRLISQPEIDLTEYGLHAYLMKKCGYTHTKIFRGESVEDRESSTQLTVAEFSRLMAEQDELARFANEGREPQHYLILPTTD